MDTRTSGACVNQCQRFRNYKHYTKTELHHQEILEALGFLGLLRNQASRPWRRLMPVAEEWVTESSVRGSGSTANMMGSVQG